MTEAGTSETNLWETVLRKVGTSKAVAQKKLLVLGDAGSGKTSVVRQLLQASQQASDVRSGAVETVSEHDLALSYSYMDVRDEDGEEIVARVGVYQLASDRTTDRELLQFVLDAQTFGAAAIVVVLDWSRPWRFVKSLLRWVHVLSAAVDAVCGESGWTPGRAAVDECRERLERFLQEYTDADADVDVGRAADVLLPLGAGVLEANLGLPIVVVCTKADTMGVLERERAFGEEDFDYVQQVLRAVCLRLGAALIYTSTHNPDTFTTLYHYLAHRMLTAPTTLSVAELNEDTMVHSPRSGRSRSGSAAVAPDAVARTVSYPFRMRANVVDRDIVFVPAGWDSAAKIGYLREPFDVAATQEAWTSDEARYRNVVERAIRAGDADVAANSVSLLLMFGAVVAAPKHRTGAEAEGNAVVTAAVGMVNEVVVEDDQAFFERLFDEQQEQMSLEGDDSDSSRLGDTSDVRARGGSSNRLVSSLLRNVHTAESSLSTASDMPDSAALSDEDDIERPDAIRHQRTDSTDTAGSVRRKLPSSASDVGSAPPNEELTSFFQNLLGRKGGQSVSANGKGSPQQASRPLVGRSGPKDIQADLERWKAQLKRQKE
ncbi:hypothetical protein LPJ69_003561 [Coemansia sp. RSA 1752]|nr:hypothetical protein LPJ69_003561 [Coemansia sp. RSA 1752]